ncbi:MAG TPA: septal ring lytic transglycosylase RlpA family protein [Saprospiraceae bacterium]|nr:septal ring lytic transglycosylase RlpA family protein [Saprospiraceae bacterium]
MKLFTTILLSTVFLFSAQANAQEFGKASYLDMAYQGAITASGEPYNANEFTGAHKIHPFGTKLRITRQDNGRSVIVRVNDRGPHIKGRIVDVSYAAAKALDMVRDGVADVKVEVVGKASPTSSPEPEEEPEVYSPPSLDMVLNNDENNDSSNPAERATESTPERNANTPKESAEKKPVTKNSGTDYSDRLLTTPYEKYGLYEIKVLQVNKAGYGVQVASLSTYENAMRELTRLQAKKINNALLSIEQSGASMSFKIIVGPYEDRPAATQQINRLRRSLGVKGFVVDLSTIQY